MGIAYFQSGQEVIIDDTPHKLLREIDTDSWQIEKEVTGLLSIKSKLELLKLYQDGKLRFRNKNDGLVKVERKSDCKPCLPSFDQVKEEQKGKAKIRYAYVTAIRANNLDVHTKESLSPIIDSVYVKLGEPGQKPHWVTVYRWWKKYVSAGFDIRALMSKDQLKGNRVRRYQDELLEIVETAVQTIYLSRERNSIKDTLDHAIVLVNKENHMRLSGMKIPLPTRSLIKKAIDRISAFERHVARYGMAAARHAYRSVLDRVTSERILERVEIDHTRLDLFVVDDETMLPLGRPWVTACIDVNSRSIMGIYIGFEPPSHLSVARCLKHALLPKMDLKEKYPDIKNDWYCYGVMEYLVVDNGLEFHSESLEALCQAYGITILYTPRKTPWYKAKIERFFRTLTNAVCQGVPGTTFNSILEKDDYDVAKNATVRLSTLKEMIYTWIVDYYHQSPHRGIANIPAIVWQEGVTQIALPVVDDIAELDAMLGRVAIRTVTHKGVEINKLFYNSFELKKLRAEYAEKFKTEIRFDDGDLGYIHILIKQTGQVLKVPAVDIEYASGLTLWQHNVITRFAQLYLDGRTDTIALAEAKERIRKLVMKDLNNKKFKSRSRSARFKTAFENEVSESGGKKDGDILKQNSHRERSSIFDRSECIDEYDEEAGSSRHKIRIKSEKRQHWKQK